MSLQDHLEELRTRIIRIAIIIFVSFGVCYNFGDVISEILLAPLREALNGDTGQIVYLGILDKVLSQFQVAFWSSLLFSSPLWFYQLWKFIRPGLYYSEVRIVRPFIFVSFVLFCAGVAFGYFLVFPFTFEMLLNFGVQDIKASISLKEYLVLSSKILVFLGVIFQLPNLLMILGFMGLVTKQSLRSWRRYVYVGFIVLSAMLTPPDVITQIGLSIPLVFLYELGILAVAFVVHPIIEKE